MFHSSIWNVKIFLLLKNNTQVIIHWNEKKSHASKNAFENYTFGYFLILYGVRKKSHSLGMITNLSFLGKHSFLSFGERGCRGVHLFLLNKISHATVYSDS